MNDGFGESKSIRKLVMSFMSGGLFPLEFIWHFPVRQSCNSPPFFGATNVTCLQRRKKISGRSKNQKKVFESVGVMQPQHEVGGSWHSDKKIKKTLNNKNERMEIHTVQRELFFAQTK